MLRPVNLWFALLGLGSSKMRSALTTLGVIIGVAAVIVIVSLGDGLRRSTQQQMEAFSHGLIEIRPAYRTMPVMVESPGAVRVVEEVEVVGGKMGGSVQQPALAIEDVAALRQLATSVSAVIGQVEAYGQVFYRGQQVPMGQIVGVPPEYLQVYHMEVKQGRFFTAQEEANAAPVLVLEEGFVRQIWGEDANPVGEVFRVFVNGVTQNFAIIGVLGSPGGMQGWTQRALVTPLRTAQLRLSQGGSSGGVGLITARVDARDSASRQFAVAQINTILRARHGLTEGTPEDYYIYDTLQFSEESQRIVQVITLVLSLIAGISLVVGSIGLMNIMLVSVSERTYEIGLRRALGARRWDILGQFLAEAALLSLLGGLIGLTLGVVGSYAISMAVEQLRGMVTVTANVVLLAVGVSAVVGIAAGLYPAWHAALLPPTQALRHGG